MAITPPQSLPESVPMGDVIGLLLSHGPRYAEGVVRAREDGDPARLVWFWVATEARTIQFRLQYDDGMPTEICDGTTAVTLSSDGAELDRGCGSNSRVPPPVGWLLTPSEALIWGRNGEDWKLVATGDLPVRDGSVRFALTGADEARGIGYGEVQLDTGILTRLVLGDTDYELIDFRDAPNPRNQVDLFRLDTVVPNELHGSVPRRDSEDWGYVDHSRREPPVDEA